MTTTKLNYHILDVFTTTKYLGNPLAIVHVPASKSAGLTQDQKQKIAREFNLSETVFMHESPPGATPDAPVKINVFTTEQELSFAGHPSVGSGWHLLCGSGRVGKEREGVTLKTKAGDVSVLSQGGGRVRIQVPIDFKEHKPIQLSSFKSAQQNLQATDYVNGLDGEEVVASIVKGATFVLLRLNSEEALKKLQVNPERITVPWLGVWQGPVALFAFYEREDGVVRARMMLGTWEDPACGAGSSALGGWLGKRKGAGSWKIEIIQGVEIGRRSEIEVHVEIGNDSEVKKLELGGAAVEVAEGLIYL